MCGTVCGTHARDVLRAQRPSFYRGEFRRGYTVGKACRHWVFVAGLAQLLSLLAMVVLEADLLHELFIDGSDTAEGTIAVVTDLHQSWPRTSAFFRSTAAT